MPLDETYTGSQAIFSAGDDEYTVSNVQLNITVQTSQIQQETSYDSLTAFGGMRYSGSFEYRGINNDWIDGLFDVNAANNLVQPKNSFISISEQNPVDPPANPDLGGIQQQIADARTIILRGVTITNVDRSIPADDVAATTIQFEADSLDIVQ